MRRGLWVDCSPARVCADGYLARVRDLSVQVVALMVQNTEGEWTWTPKQVERATLVALSLDLEVVLTTWPRPHDVLHDWAREAADRLEHGAVALEVDLEGQWRGSASARSSLALVECLGELAEEHDVRIEVTTFPAHPEAGSAARVSPHVDRLNIQLYSVRHRPGGRLVDPSSRLGPGRYQREALVELARVPWLAAEGSPRLGVGLAAFGQDWPGIEPGEAYARARAAVGEAGGAVVEERVWSSKWVVGAKASTWAAAAIR